MKGKVTTGFSILLIFAMLAGCGQTKSTGETNSASVLPTEKVNISETTDSPADPTQEPNGSEELTIAETLNFHYAESDAEILGLLKSDQWDTETAVANSEAISDDAVTETSAAFEAGDYSETNHQVDGVDEADIIKTNGEYIYAINGLLLEVFKADGENTSLVNTLNLGSEEAADENDYIAKTPQEMYISGEMLIVISAYYAYYDADSSSQNYIVVDFFRLDQQPDNPELVGSLGQDGYLSETRVTDGKLYVISNYYVWNYDEENPDEYLPGVYNDSERSNLDLGEICIAADYAEESYNIACAYDIASADFEGKLSVLGGSGTVYMDTENLYLAKSRYDLQQGDPYTDGVYTVTDCSGRTVTDITRIELETMKVSAAATVEGSLDNQFAMDTRDGYLRMVTTTSRDEYKVYEDKEKGFTNYKRDDEIQSTTNLYILDSDMQLTGVLTGLAKGEYVYSVRFDGDIAYFCTFKQVDPLFAVDVSDPEAPTLLGELKITGFSEYLHIWDEGLLLGIGLEADEETGASESIKLVMFDNSDPKNITVKSSTELESTYSAALYDHRAVFVDREHNIIGFEDSENGKYLIYGYDDSGFVLRAEIGDGCGYNCGRGMYIGDYVYVYTGFAMYVLTLDSIEQVAAVGIAVG